MTMANKYHIYVGGMFDEHAGCYRNGNLDSTFDTEREAFYREKELLWKGESGIYMEREGDEVFTIVPCSGMGLNYLIVDRRTESRIYGACVTYDEALEHKAYCEKRHYEHWYKDYYDQFKAA